MTVRFEATLDDLVDVSMRTRSTSNTRRVRRMTLVPIVFLVGLSVFAFALRGDKLRFIGVLLPLLIAGGFYLAFYRNSVERKVRRLCLEQMGSDAPFLVEVELTEPGVKISQLKEQYTHDWSTIAEIEESEDAVYFYQYDGSIFAVRKRGFESEEMKEQFLEIARRYVGNARRSNYRR